MAASSYCPHSRTRLIAQDKDAEYRECLDCGAILEKDELATEAAAQAASAGNATLVAPASGAAPGNPASKDSSAEKSGFDESLSDA